MTGAMKKLRTCLWLLPLTGLLFTQADARVQAGFSQGQAIYVPVYSHIYQGDRESPVYLAVTLSIRNVDPATPITILYADYHDSQGRLLKEYQEGPVPLPPSQSIRCVVAESDKAGGSGAFFRVDRKSSSPAIPPLLESVMIGTKSQQDISFTSRGVVLPEGAAEKTPGKAD